MTMIRMIPVFLLAAAGVACGAGSTVVLHDSFREIGPDGLPVGWEAWKPRPQMALRFSPLKDVRSLSGGATYQMSGEGNRHAKGSLQRQLANLSPDKYYRFRALYTTRGIENRQNTTYPFVKWGEKRLRLLEPVEVKDGWVQTEVILRPPAEANGILFKTAILLDCEGGLAGKYHQAQLDAPQSLLGEFSRGDKISVMQTDFGKIGVLICWDYHFPEAVRSLVLQGAEMLFVPLAGDGRLFEDGVSMGAEHTGKAIALDNRVPIVFSATKGSFSATKGSSKNPSLIIDTQARVLARSSDAEHIIAAAVDTKARVHQWTGAEFRSLYFADRRPEPYKILSTTPGPK